MSDLELCNAVLNDLIKGIELIEGSCPCNNLEVEEDAIEGTEILLQVSVLLEPLLPEEYRADIAREIQHLLSEMITQYDHDTHYAMIRGRGGPPLGIPEDQLRFLLENEFKIRDIAGIFACSTCTIQRRMRDYGIDPNRFSDISDSQLDEVVSELAVRLPDCGIRSIQSMLRLYRNSM